MAIGVHIARVAVFNVDHLGNIIKKDDPNVTLRQHLSTSMEHRVLVDAAIPNTANNPPVKAYIEAEAASNYVLQYMDQTTIITYLRTASGGFQ